MHPISNFRRLYLGLRHALWQPEVLGAAQLVVTLIVLATFVYRTVEGWSWLDAAYFSVVTIATVGYGVLASAADPLTTYLGSLACTGCHVAEAEAWAASDHARAWTRPAEETVLGDFDDARFEHDGVTTRFFRRDGGWFIETLDGAGARRAFHVVGVAGRDPLQQYLLAPEPGRTKVDDIAWDVAGRQWYPVFPGDPPPPGDGFHWTGPPPVRQR